MSWCPKCIKEYDDTVSVCKTCGVSLLTTPEKYQYEVIAYVEKEIAQRLVKLLHFSEIPEAIMVYDTFNHNYEVQVDRSNYKKASDLVRIFKENEFDANYSEDAEFGSDEEYIEVEVPIAGKYTKTVERYRDNLSSGVTFIICGLIGFIALILENIGVITVFSSAGTSRIISDIVLGALFAVFTGVGISSLRYSKKLKKQSESEEIFTEKLLEWLQSNLPIESIESTYSSEIPEEMKYFRRIEVIKDALSKNYSSLDEEYLIQIADDYYSKIFHSVI